MKKRFSEEQIIGFLRKAEAGVAVKEMCRERVQRVESTSAGRSFLTAASALANSVPTSMPGLGRTPPVKIRLHLPRPARSNPG
jgi:hypothetical protein